MLESRVHKLKDSLAPIIITSPNGESESVLMKLAVIFSSVPLTIMAASRLSSHLQYSFHLRC